MWPYQQAPKAACPKAGDVRLGDLVLVVDTGAISPTSHQSLGQCLSPFCFAIPWEPEDMLLPGAWCQPGLGRGQGGEVEPAWGRLLFVKTEVVTTSSPSAPAKGPTPSIINPRVWDLTRPALELWETRSNHGSDRRSGRMYKAFLIKLSAPGCGSSARFLTSSFFPHLLDSS